MGRFLNFLLVAGLAAAVAYLVWFRKPEVTVIERTTVAPAPATPIRRLSGFVDAHADKIFSPLAEKDAVIVPTQELRQVRATLADLAAKTADEQDKRLYLAGVGLCDGLLVAIGRREAAARRLADSIAKPPLSLETNPAKRAEDIKRKQKFFNEGITKGWAAEAADLRSKMARAYDAMRLLER